MAEERRRLEGVPVLVVEDDPASAKLMAVILAGEGCEVRVAHSAEAALATLQTFRPRMVVVDVVLPRMNGIALAHRLKEDPATRGMVILAVSAIDSAPTERLALDVGCVGYLLKPIDALALPSIVCAHLDRGAS
jgi:CheY-like chemotaxis protein